MDGTNETERDAIDWLILMEAEKDASAAVIAMPWIQDDIANIERDALEWLRWLAYNSKTVAAAVFAMPWVQDGITDTERDALEWLSWMANYNEAATIAVIAMPWVQDGITDTESDALERLSWMANYNEAATIAVIAMPWVQDGITNIEGYTFEWLRWLAKNSETVAPAILAMPFLESFESDDALAIQGIAELARAEDDSLLPALMDHPTLRNGITDDFTTLVAAAGTHWDAEEIRRILSPGYADIETLSEGTRLTPNLKISIIRAGTQPQPHTAEIARDAVEFAEGIMQLSLPVSHLIVVLNDKTGNKGYGGTNHGYAFSYDPESEQKQDYYGKYLFQSGFVHEVAHYYWRLGPSWVDEGVANTFEYLYGVENGVSLGLLKKPRRNNCEAHDLEMLTEWNPGVEDFDRFYCNYFLGQMLFHELLETLGTKGFNERLRELYRLSLEVKAEGDTPGIAEVRQAFHDQSEIVEKHWSGKLNAPENRPYDEGVYRTNHDLIQWHQYPTYDGNYVTFSGTLLGDAVLSQETLRKALQGGHPNFSLSQADQYEFAAYIMPPFDDGRKWDLANPNDTVAYRYLFNDSGKTFEVEFPFPNALANPSDYVVIAWGFSDESGTPFFNEEIDQLGYARIRAE